MKFLWNWIPQKSYGPFRFNERIDFESFGDQLILVDPASEVVDQDSFELVGERVTVTVEEKTVSFVETYNELIFRGANLIGENSDKVRNMISGEWKHEEASGDEEEWSNQTHGITLWVNDNVVTSITVGADEDEDAQSS